MHENPTPYVLLPANGHLCGDRRGSGQTGCDEAEEVWRAINSLNEAACHEQIANDPKLALFSYTNMESLIHQTQYASVFHDSVVSLSVESLHNIKIDPVYHLNTCS